MELLKDYLRAKEYCNKYAWVYTYNKHGKKVLLFGNKAKILNQTLGFTFLDCEVSFAKLTCLNDEIDIIINYRGDE